MSKSRTNKPNGIISNEFCPILGACRRSVRPADGASAPQVRKEARNNEGGKIRQKLCYNRGVVKQLNSVFGSV